MKILVIPDVHLKPELFDLASARLKEGAAQKAVCLMDIPDDWGQESNISLYEKTLDRAVSFSKEHPDTLWCWGNHDTSYLWQMPETGYSKFAQFTVTYKLDRLEVRSAVARPYSICTPGGQCPVRSRRTDGTVRQ